MSAVRGAALIFRDTPGSGWPADAKQENVAPRDTRALAFVIRTGRSIRPNECNNNCLVEGVTVETRWATGSCSSRSRAATARDVEVMGTATGVRIEGVDGSRRQHDPRVGRSQGRDERRPEHRCRHRRGRHAAHRVGSDQPASGRDRHQRQYRQPGRLRLPDRPAADQLWAGVWLRRGLTSRHPVRHRVKLAAQQRREHPWPGQPAQRRRGG